MTLSDIAKSALSSSSLSTTVQTRSDRAQQACALDRTGHPPRKKLLLSGSEDAAYARQTVEKIFAESSLVDVHQPIDLPLFSQDELHLGKVLGTGCFGIVTEVKKFDASTIKKYSDLHDGGNLQKGREFIARHCLRRRYFLCHSCRYAIKQPKHKNNSTSDAYCHDNYIQGLIDLGVETHLLSVMEHPNIIKLRGLTEDGYCSNNYFIVLDRLYGILDRKLKTWLTQLIRAEKRSQQFQIQSLLEERLTAAFGLSCGLTYLHNNNIMYRDLKPENIGFDIRGDVKIFDFGLAREVLPQKMLHDGTFLLSSNTGTPRYMSPEVALGQPYNLKADVYSFSVLLWEMISLEKPYRGYSLTMLRDGVYLGGTRPLTDCMDYCPKSIVSLIKCGWSPDSNERPDMATFKVQLKNVLKKMRSGDDSGLDDTRRRSTYIFEGQNHFLRMLSDMSVYTSS